MGGRGLNGTRPAFAQGLRRGSFARSRTKAGAGGGTRTHTMLPSRDFKSLASTSSATSACLLEFGFLARLLVRWKQVIFAEDTLFQQFSAADGKAALCFDRSCSKTPRCFPCHPGKASIRTPAAALGNLNLIRLRKSDVRSLLLPEIVTRRHRVGPAFARNSALRLCPDGRHRVIGVRRSRQI